LRRRPPVVQTLVLVVLVLALVAAWTLASTALALIARTTLTTLATLASVALVALALLAISLALLARGTVLVSLTLLAWRLVLLLAQWWLLARIAPAIVLLRLWLFAQSRKRVGVQLVALVARLLRSVATLLLWTRLAALLLHQLVEVDRLWLGLWRVCLLRWLLLAMTLQLLVNLVGLDKLGWLRIEMEHEKQIRKHMK
jgi:hypothetical protein